MKDMRSAVKKFQGVFREAKEKSMNEADTRMRIRLMFSEILGFDMLNEITQEHMVQSHYVDLTVKVKDKIVLFIEAKSVDTTLRETHVYQTTNYAATGGVNLCMLTNGIDYRLFYLTWNKEKVESTLVLSFNLLDDDMKELCEKLSLLTRESFRKNALGKHVAEVSSLDSRNLLLAMLSARVLTALRLELKQITGHNVREDALERCIAGMFNEEMYNTAKACLKKKTRNSAVRKSSTLTADSTPAETTCSSVPMVISDTLKSVN